MRWEVYMFLIWSLWMCSYHCRVDAGNFSLLDEILLVEQGNEYLFGLFSVESGWPTASLWMFCMSLRDNHGRCTKDVLIVLNSKWSLEIVSSKFHWLKSVIDWKWILRLIVVENVPRRLLCLAVSYRWLGCFCWPFPLRSVFFGGWNSWVVMDWHAINDYLVQ